MNTNSIVDKLKANGFGLGGSRRMAEKYPNQVVVTAETDWDFYCEDSPEKRKFLEDNGFLLKDCENRNYWDDLLVDMYDHWELPIEVLIRKDVSIYKSSFEALSAEVFIERLWKSSPLADPNIPRQFFRMNVCDYFNGIFRLHGWKNLCNIEGQNDLPF